MSTSSEQPKYYEGIPAQTSPRSVEAANQLFTLGVLALVLLTVLVVIAVYRNIIRPWTYKKTLSLTFTKRQDERINFKLTELLTETYADRAILTQFGNGSRTLGGMSIKSLYITHEQVVDGVKKAQSEFNSQPVPCVNLVVSSLAQEGFRKRATKDIEDERYKSFLLGLGVKWVAYKLLVDKDTPVGFIALHFMNGANEHFWIALEENDFEDAASGILRALWEANGPLGSFPFLSE